MYQYHPAFKQAKDQNKKLWRYMDLPKFLSILHQRALFFNRVDNFPDRNEGILTKLDIEDQRHRFEDWKSGLSQDLLDLNPDLEFIPTHHYFNPKFFAANCWHENEYESAAMWDLYSQKDQGIAIVSTWRRLKTCIIDDHVVYVGRVKYIDRDTARTDQSNGLIPLIQKGMSYKHENEVRALVHVPSRERDPEIPFKIRQDVETIKGGLQIKIRPEILIESIYLAPQMPAWQSELVRDLITKYGFGFYVCQSVLYDNPLI